MGRDEESGGNLAVGVNGKHTSTRGVTRGYVHIDPQGCTRGYKRAQSNGASEFVTKDYASHQPFSNSNKEKVGKVGHFGHYGTGLEVRSLSGQFRGGKCR